MEQLYNDSNYRFTDPIRFFKANDPYYFEVENIPLKQLQENCLWLKDQVKKTVEEQAPINVLRSNFQELLPYAGGGDRVVKVKPGRYTARINDASNRNPLAYLRKVLGEALGEVDAFITAVPNAGTFPDDGNAKIMAALEKFKSVLSQNALGMTGLESRAFTWPVKDVDYPINNTGVKLRQNSSFLSYGSSDENPGTTLLHVPMVIAQALTWAKSINAQYDTLALPTYDFLNYTNGWGLLPKTESYFVKKWRGVSRLSVVDIKSELSIEVPQFDPADFSYIDENGDEKLVDGVQSRIDLIFIYSKPIDSSGVTILRDTGKVQITEPALGIVRGAGIRASFKDGQYNGDWLSETTSEHNILASPGDQFNENMGFTATSGNDIAFDVRGSFPSPDDLMNLAPLISEKLEAEAYELIGQSILPVAYVWVQEGSQVVQTTDVIDIRPFFRTAELAYNERAGIAAAFPQLSLANPAVGKGQLDLEIKKTYDYFTGELANLEEQIQKEKIGVRASGYVFGGFYFGPEGALYSFEEFENNQDGIENRKQIVTEKYYPTANNITIPEYPDWDLADWCVVQDLENKGKYPNDYINTFIGGPLPGPQAVYKGSLENVMDPGFETIPNGAPFSYTSNLPGEYSLSPSVAGVSAKATTQFSFFSKKIKFNRPANLVDYSVDISFLNSLPLSETLHFISNSSSDIRSRNNFAKYAGYWIEKGYDHFTIYVAVATPDTVFVPANTDESFVFSSKKAPGYGGAYRAPETYYDSKFAGFLVITEEVRKRDFSTIGNIGFEGNPRALMCTYPTIMWNLTGVSEGAKDYHYGNLNGTNPTINLLE